VVAGTTDGCASFLATGASKPGDGVSALGSTLTIKLLSDKPVYAPQYGIYSHRIGDRWLAGGASNTGGAVLAKYFSAEDIQRLSATIDLSMPTALDYYPLAAAGERFPINDSTLQPRLSPRPATDDQFLHGILQGIANIEQLAYQRLSELGAPALDSLRSVGGGSKNEVWTHLRHQTLNVPFVHSVSDQAAVGSASLARDGFMSRLK
jgi:sugar (pentulose or hexulose) kinase